MHTAIDYLLINMHMSQGSITEHHYMPQRVLKLLITYA